MKDISLRIFTKFLSEKYKNINNNYNNNMNQIISYNKVKSKKMRMFFYIQFVISIIVIFILLIYMIIKKENNTQINSDIKVNFKLNEIYQINSQNNYLGILIIDKINLEYPIFNEFSEENLKISICKFSGNSLHENGNITILGHNYRNKFFGNLEKLEMNDKIILDSNGEKFNYYIFMIYETNSNDLECLKPIYNNSKEITLVTCKNNSKKKRLIIKAIKKE